MRKVVFITPQITHRIESFLHLIASNHKVTVLLKDQLGPPKELNRIEILYPFSSYSIFNMASLFPFFLKLQAHAYHFILPLDMDLKDQLRLKGLSQVLMSFPNTKVTISSIEELPVPLIFQPDQESLNSGKNSSFILFPYGLDEGLLKQFDFKSLAHKDLIFWGWGEQEIHKRNTLRSLFKSWNINLKIVFPTPEEKMQQWTDCESLVILKKDDNSFSEIDVLKAVLNYRKKFWFSPVILRQFKAPWKHEINCYVSMKYEEPKQQLAFSEENLADLNLICSQLENSQLRKWSVDDSSFLR